MTNYDSLISYYSRRAPDYDGVWQRDDPERQAEQGAMAGAIRELMRGCSVLEVACGTGYWTQFAAETARQVLAIDASEEMLNRARRRSWPRRNVNFATGDAYRLNDLAGEFDAGLAAFWFSHIPRARLAGFLNGLCERLDPGSPVFLADNMPLPGVGGELVTAPNSPDTFKRRHLSDGSEHLVLKNYFSRVELESIFQNWGATLDLHLGKCFWWVTYRIV